MLGRENKQEDDQTFLSSSAIVSSTISPRRPGVFSVPVKVVLQNREVCALMLARLYLQKRSLSFYVHRQ